MSSLTFDKSLLHQDISDIIKSPKLKYNAVFPMAVRLHTEEKDLDVRDGLLIASIGIVRDYINNMSDYTEIVISVPLGTYIYDIYPYLDNIEVTVVTMKQLYQDRKPFIRDERYKAVYLLEKNSAIPNTVNQTKEDLNQNLPITITLQLLDRSVETIRIKTTQGSFDPVINPKNKIMEPKAFLKSIISNESDKILVENKPIIDNISIEEPDNKEPLKSITIPSNTRIVELPEYLQTKSSGVYNSGIGNYVQVFGTDHYTYKKTFFVYSLYNPKKYDDSEYKIIFYSPVTSSLSITDITYKYEDKILRVVPKAISKIDDPKEVNLMSKGSGFRTSNANSMMKKPVELTEDGPVFKPNRLNTEIVFKERKDGLNFAPNQGVSNNHFVLSSEVLKNTGVYVTLEVYNLDHDFIYPGAACMINYEDKEGNIKALKGVIHRAIVKYDAPSSNPTQDYNASYTLLSSQMQLSVFVHLEESQQGAQ